MKRGEKYISAILLVLCFLAVSIGMKAEVYAEDEYEGTIGGYNYKKNSENQVAVTYTNGLYREVRYILTYDLYDNSDQLIYSNYAINTTSNEYMSVSDLEQHDNLLTYVQGFAGYSWGRYNIYDIKLYCPNSDMTGTNHLEDCEVVELDGDIHAYCCPTCGARVTYDPGVYSYRLENGTTGSGYSTQRAYPTHPITDVNGDYVCDVCGLFFGELPVAPSEGDGGNDYYISPLESELEEVVDTLKQNPSSEPATVTWDKGDSLPLNVMETLKENPSISLLFDFEYEGVKHTVLIPAGQAFADESIPWYGPLWLLQTFGEYDPNSKGAYTVQSGDSLNEIARRNGLTLDELLKKNPQISDINLIYPGEVINL